MSTSTNSVLTAAQIDAFKNEGYLILPQMVSTAQCKQMIEISREHLAHKIGRIEYEADVGYIGAPKSRDSEGGHTARRLRDAYQRHAVYQNWATNKKLIAILQTLLEEPVFLTLSHHNCIMTKHPEFSSATDWHRDIRYWSFPRNALISVWLALDKENQENGGLCFIPGSHQLEIQGTQLDHLDFLRNDIGENQALFAQGKDITLEQGDVVLFHSGLFHAAGNNQDHSKKIKQSVVFAYHGESNPPLQNTPSSAFPSIGPLVGKDTDSH